MLRLLVNYDHLPKSEISDFIIRKFHNNDENGLKEVINAKLQNDYSASNIRKVVSDMGMTCNEKTDGCEYNGYVVTTLLKEGSRSSVKQIYHASIDIQKGINSFSLQKILWITK